MTQQAEITQVVAEHTSHLETVSPGLPAAFTAGCVAGDCIAQGDLYLTVIDEVPEGYTLQAAPSRQLVPEGGAGSHHRIKSLSSVEVYYPAGWEVDKPTNRLDGPVIVTKKETDIVHEAGHAHPHGTVTIPGGTKIECTYQRTWDAAAQEIRRQMD